MQPCIIVTHFNETTFKEYMLSPRTRLGHRQRVVSYPAGTIVVLVNNETACIIGVCALANWEDSSSPCREKHHLDADVYGGDNKKYDKYEIKIENLRILKNAVTFDEVKMLVGAGPHHGNTNLWKKSHLTYRGAFVHGEDQTPLERYKIWVKSLL